jgi:hypothetical protein
MLFFTLKKWWDHNGWTYLFLFSIVFIFLYWFFFTRFHANGTSTANLNHILNTVSNGLQSTAPPSSLQPPSPFRNSSSCFMSKGEKVCKEFLEFTFHKKFEKVRPEFLRNPVTGYSLELDLYNPELRLAIEYNGKQHYHYNSMMHQSSRDRFHNQQYKDIMKKDMCQKNNITLIVVPYTVPEDKIPEYLYEQLRQHGFL